MSTLIDKKYEAEGQNKEGRQQKVPSVLSFFDTLIAGFEKK
jgi:hypothetical protein